MKIKDVLIVIMAIAFDFIAVKVLGVIVDIIFKT
jgi:hypothetical protein